MDNSIYQIDFRRLVNWLLPKPVRKPVFVAWLMALISPVIRLYSNLLAFRSLVIYRLTITPQVCFLERALNDKYDTVDRRIRIKDAGEFNPIPLFKKVEGKAVSLYLASEGKAAVLYTRAETGRFGVDFIVEVPVFVAFDPAEMTAFINGYKLATKTFKIRIV